MQLGFYFLVVFFQNAHLLIVLESFAQVLLLKLQKINRQLLIVDGFNFLRKKSVGLPAPVVCLGIIVIIYQHHFGRVDRLLELLQAQLRLGLVVVEVDEHLNDALILLPHQLWHLHLDDFDTLREFALCL